MSRRALGKMTMLRDVAPLMQALRAAHARGEDVGLQVAPEFAKVFGMPPALGTVGTVGTVPAALAALAPLVCATCHGLGDILVDGKPVACEECTPDAVPCAHEDVALECDYCHRAIDRDTMRCHWCGEGVAGVTRCVYCQEVVA